MKIIALGGVRNAKITGDRRGGWINFCFDAGLKYPENEQLGVDVAIPNMDYLLRTATELRVLSWPMVTRGCYWSFALSFYGNQGACVFGSELTIELAKLFVKNNDVKKFNDFHDWWKYRNWFEMWLFPLFRTTHWYQRAWGLVIKTDEENMFTQTIFVRPIS